MACFHADFANGRTGSRAGELVVPVARMKQPRQNPAMRIEDWNGEIGGPHWWARVLSFTAVMGVLLGVLGPYGSYLNGGVVPRTLYWVGMTQLGTVMIGVQVPLLFRLAAWIGLPRLFSLVAAILLASVPIAAVSAVICRAVWGGIVARLTWIDWYSQAALTSAIIIGLWILLEFAIEARRKSEIAPSAQPAPRMAEPSGPVLCLQMEDHYVRIHRRSGSTLELLPLHEAIGRFGGADGLQVHRSWWVSAQAVTGAERDARNWRLRLTNGLTVPVARNRVTEARTRGWIVEDA